MHGVPARAAGQCFCFHLALVCGCQGLSDCEFGGILRRTRANIFVLHQQHSAHARPHPMPDYQEIWQNQGELMCRDICDDCRCGIFPLHATRCTLAIDHLNTHPDPMPVWNTYSRTIVPFVQCDLQTFLVFSRGRVLFFRKTFFA